MNEHTRFRCEGLLAIGLLLSLTACPCGPKQPVTEIAAKPPEMPKAQVVQERLVEKPSHQKVSFRFAPTKAAGIVVTEPAPKPPFTLEFLGGKGSSVLFELPYQCICPCGQCACPPQPAPPTLEGVPLLALESGAQVPWDGREVRVEWHAINCPDGKSGRARTGSLQPAPPGHYRVTFNIGRDPRDCKGLVGSQLTCAAVSEVVVATAEFDLPAEGDLTVDVASPPR